MKIKLNIFLFLLTTSGYCQSLIQNDKILLINYFEHTDCEVIEVDEKNDSNYNPCDYDYIDIDDFSQYFPIKKVFYYDGFVKLTENDKILIWDYDNKKEVENFPFAYSKIKINALENDTTVKLILNNIEKVLSPNNILRDTIILIKKEDGKTVKYTTFVSVNNLGLIKKENIIDNINWKTKSFDLRLDAPNIAEIMPEFEGGQDAFRKYLIENIKLQTLEKSENINFTLYVEFIIDEYGKITTSTILRGVSPAIDNLITEVLQNMPKWKPGMNFGKAVAVKMILPIQIELN